MHPILIEIGPLVIHTYGVFIAAAFLAGMAVAMRRARARGRDPVMVQDLGFYAIVGAIAGSRLLYVLLNWRYFLEHPLESLMFWKGGLVFQGGALLAVGLMAWLVKRRRQSVLEWADICVPGLALGQAIGRLGCLAAGCCYGKACSLPWAITFTHPDTLAPVGVPLHPTQLYAVLAGLVNFAALMTFGSRFRTMGRVAGLYICIYAPSRILIELFRDDFRGDLGPFSTTQLIAGLLFFAGLWLLLRPGPRQTSGSSA